MGNILNGIIGGAGNLIGSGVERKADKAGAQQALTGYNYLSGPNGVQGYVNNGNGANSAAASLLGVGGGTPGTPGTPAGGLLYANQGARGNTPLQDIHAAQAQGRTITAAQWAQAGYNPDGTPMQGTAGTSGAAGANSAFSNYLNSTGYKFQQQQGQQAIGGLAASRGLLGSGATGKALMQFGQNLGANYFQNYLTQLNTQATQGLSAAGMIGNAGTVGGGNAGKLTAMGGQAVGTADAATANMFAGLQ